MSFDKTDLLKQLSDITNQYNLNKASLDTATYNLSMTQSSSNIKGDPKLIQAQSDAETQVAASLSKLDRFQTELQKTVSKSSTAVAYSAKDTPISTITKIIGDIDSVKEKNVKSTKLVNEYKDEYNKIYYTNWNLFLGTLLICFFIFNMKQTKETIKEIGKTIQTATTTVVAAATKPETTNKIK